MMRHGISRTGIALGMALIITAGLASAGLAEGTVAVVNGIPGGRVDVCIGSAEVKSRLPFGGKLVRTVADGSRVLRVFRADPRTCRGTLLARKGFQVASGTDLTLVASAKRPKVVTFDNAGLGTSPPDGAASEYAPWAWRHAADIGKVNVRYKSSFHGGGYQPIQPEPYTGNIWRKGDQEISDTAFPVTTYRLRATRPGKTAAITTSKAVTLEASRRYEWYLVGTTGGNARWVVLERAISESELK